MRCEFIGNSKHYTKGKEYEIRSKFCKILGSEPDSISNIIAVYNINDPAAKYKFENSSVVSIKDNYDATSNVPYRTYKTIEDFLKDWKVIEP